MTIWLELCKWNMKICLGLESQMVYKSMFAVALPRSKGKTIWQKVGACDANSILNYVDCFFPSLLACASALLYIVKYKGVKTVNEWTSWDAVLLHARQVRSLVRIIVIIFILIVMSKCLCVCRYSIGIYFKSMESLRSNRHV